MKRVKLKRHFKTSKINLIVILLIALVISLYSAFKYLNKAVAPYMFNYATSEAKKISTMVINSAIETHITNKTKAQELFTIKSDSNGEIKSIDFNTAIVNSYLTEATKSIQVNMKNIEDGNIDELEFADVILKQYDRNDLKKGIVYRLSSGALLSNPFFANLGPKIPVKVSLMGEVTSSISTEVKNYGINNALIQVYVNLNITEQVLLPVFTRKIHINSKVPIAMKLINGSIPSYYMNGLNSTSPSLMVPVK